MSSQPRHGEPLPLGNEELPYSKGMMARALIATDFDGTLAPIVAEPWLC